MNRETIWTIAKIVSVAAIAALLMKYENSNPKSEATARGSLAKMAFMWTLGFAIATVGGLAIIGTVGGAAAIIGAVALAVGVISIFMGSADPAKDRAVAAYNDRFNSEPDAEPVDATERVWTDYNADDREPLAPENGR